MTDRCMEEGCTDGKTHRKIMLLLHTLNIGGSYVASLVEFCPEVEEEIV